MRGCARFQNGLPEKGLDRISRPHTWFLNRENMSGSRDPKSGARKNPKMETVDPILGFSLFTNRIEWLARSKISGAEKSQDGNSRPHTWFVFVFVPSTTFTFKDPLYFF